MTIEIEIQTENGSAFGYVADNDEPNILNYLGEHTHHANTIARLLNKRFGKIALLRNMHVDEDFRGRGEGADLVFQFIESARMHGAEIFVLISDSEERQGEGFDLVRFYEGFDLTASINTSSGPLMFSDEGIANEVKKLVKRKNLDFSPCP